MTSAPPPPRPDGSRRSVWHSARFGGPRTEPRRAAPSPLPGSADVVVVGAGVVGLSTAVLLAQTGARVVVLESREVGAGTTGHSTAKISLLQGTRLSTMLERQGRGLTAAYVAGNRAGQDWLLAHADAEGLAVQRRAGVTYAASDDERPAAEHELEAALALDLPVRWRPGVNDLPFPFAGGVALEDQAQVDPLALLRSLAARATALGCEIHERTRATSVSRGTVTTPRGDVSADRVVVATGIPFTDSGGFFARLEPHRSYALALARVDGEPESPLDMHLSAGSPSRSIRDAVLPDGRTAVLVGGNGHVVGRSPSEIGAVADLTAWAQRHFPGRDVIASWSAQDYQPVDQLPHVGPLLPLGDRTLVATGFGKWGMAAGPAAAMVLAGTVLGSTPAWADAFGSWERHELRGLGTAIRANAAVTAHLVTDRLATVGPPTRAAWEGGTPTEGTGWTGDGPIDPVAVSTTAGTTRAVSAVCPHLGGVVRWNDAECTWDCPLHGSRFAADGTLLEGPATADLAPRDLPEPPGSAPALEDA